MGHVGIKEVHISTIKIGDTIEHLGLIQTVSGTNISTSSFMGVSIFGDSYRLGMIPVKKVTFNC